jgi:hypothetical protein
MPLFQNICVYQTYPCQAVQFRRSEGLNPEYGYVDVSLRDLKKIEIVAAAMPWRNVINVQAQLPIEAWFEIAKKGHQTLTAPVEQMPPSGGGLNLYGNLVMQTLIDGKARSEMRYHDVYVDSSGIEETTEGLANIKEHSEGIVRIPLTDIRKYYREYGYLAKRINTKLRTGKFDPTSIRADGSPWSMNEVLEYLFSQLPGAPALDGGSDIYSLSFAPPTDIIGEFDPVVQSIERVIEKAGLTAHLLPDNRYAVMLKGTRRVDYDHVPSSIGKSVKGEYQNYERKSVYVTDRPPLVQVWGKKRIRRVTHPCIPIFKDPSDGRWYKLKDVGYRMQGYGIEKVKAQIFEPPEKSFKDVPPGDFSDVHVARREALLKYAFKAYCPAFMFEIGQSTIIPSLGDDDIERIQYLPMKESGWYMSELGTFGSKIPIPSSKTKGDLGDFVLMPPIVRGARVGQNYFFGFEEIQAAYKKLVKANGDKTKELKNMLSLLQRQQVSVGIDVLEAEITADRTYDPRKAQTVGMPEGNMDFELYAEALLNETKKSSESLSIGAGLDARGRDIANTGTMYWDNTAMGKEKIRQEVRAAAETLQQKRPMLAAIKGSIEETNNHLAANQNEYITMTKEFESFSKIIKGRTAIFSWMNLPWGVIETGAYSLDENTGIIEFSEPICVMDKPFFLTRDGAKVISDGAVYITFGYELNRNQTADYTSFLFTAAEDTGALNQRKVKCVGLNRSSPVACYGVRAPTMRMYETDEGIPMNLSISVASAESHAEGLIGQQRISTGYVFVYNGFYSCVLDGGITGVQHEWDSKSSAMTHIFHNAPNSKGPAGPPALSGRQQIQTVHVRERIEAERDR